MRTIRAVVLGLVGLVVTGCTGSAPSRIEVYAGGVAGVQALADPASSTNFRSLGGGLYLHNNGWAALTPAQKRATLKHFTGHPIAIELGFAEGATAWAKLYRRNYVSMGIKPTFIAANAFAGNNKPTVEGWERYTMALRGAGLPETSLVLPTFEYANFKANIPTLAQNTVSQRPDFQQIISFAGGIVLDSPPRYAQFAREENYRTWVVDAIHWTRKRGLEVVWITSPHVFNSTFREDTVAFLKYLHQRGAMPTIIVSQNYRPNAGADYINVVGPESQPQTPLAVGRYLLAEVLPTLQARQPTAGAKPN